MPVQITARRDGFRRLGIAHSANTITYPDDRFTKADVDILKAEPNLIVIEVAELTDSAPLSDELIAAQDTIIELQDKVLRLNNDVAELKNQLDASQTQLTIVTDERDELQAKLAAVTTDGKDTTEKVKAASGKKKG